jgi:Peptidase M50B-like
MSKSVEELLREIDGGDTAQGSTAVAPARQTAPRRQRIRESTMALLLGAVLLIAVLGSIPYLSLALYPFALFVTLLHESSHALVGTITGGSVTSLQISPDLSGVTGFNGGIQALIAPAGYLGATVAGAIMLLTPLRYSRWVLGGFALVPVAALAAFHPADTFTAVWCAIFALGLAAAAWKLPSRFRAFLQIFLGLEAGLNAFRDLLTLVFISGSGAHIHTDAEAMSRALFLPPPFWAISWTALSVVILAASVRLVFRRDLSQLRA